MADRLRTAFASWYDNGHTNEEEVPNAPDWMVLLKNRLSEKIRRLECLNNCITEEKGVL